MDNQRRQQKRSQRQPEFHVLRLRWVWLMFTFSGPGAQADDAPVSQIPGAQQ